MSTAGAHHEETAEEEVEHRPMMWLLLVTLVVLQFGYPVTYEGTGWTLAYLLVYIGIVVFSVRRANSDRRRYWPLFVASVALVVGTVWYAFAQHDDTAVAAMLAGVGTLQLALLVSLTRSLVSPPPAARTIDLLLTAVCTYLLLGGFFGMASGLMELGSAGSFVDPNAGGLTWQGLLYGSYVTLATLGFGDIVPVSPWARSMWSFEALLGTLFVAVVIARLVGVAGFAPRDRQGDDAS